VRSPLLFTITDLPEKGLEGPVGKIDKVIKLIPFEGVL
jgi:hypothetical protein